MKDELPKIRDVARIAGVSTATVSRALSQPSLVSERTRVAVMHAIAATGYRPNEAARNLRHRRTGGIVALVPDLANPFFAKILSGIASVIGPAGYNLLIVDTHNTEIAQLADYADPSRADGMIILDGSVPKAVFSGKVPMVEACEWVLGFGVPRIKIDNRAAAGLAIDHLVALGHTRIGHVTAPKGNVLSEARLSGTHERLAARGLSLPPDAIYQGDFSLESGRKAAECWLNQSPDTRPTAIFLASDAMACGFMGEVQRHGLSVPVDVSIVGFDDIELTSHVAPPLTTIHQPRLAIGKVAAERLLKRIEGEPDIADDTIMPVELIIRKSTASPKTR